MSNPFGSTGALVGLLKETVMYELRCKDVGFDCPGVVSGATKEDVLKHAAAHAVEVHNTQVTPALAEKVSALIQRREDASPGTNG